MLEVFERWRCKQTDWKTKSITVWFFLWTTDMFSWRWAGRLSWVSAESAESSFCPQSLPVQTSPSSPHDPELARARGPPPCAVCSTTYTIASVSVRGGSRPVTPQHLRNVILTWWSLSPETQTEAQHVSPVRLIHSWCRKREKENKVDGWWRYLACGDDVHIIKRLINEWMRTNEEPSLLLFAVSVTPELVSREKKERPAEQRLTAGVKMNWTFIALCRKGPTEKSIDCQCLRIHYWGGRRERRGLKRARAKRGRQEEPRTSKIKARQ